MKKRLQAIGEARLVLEQPATRPTALADRRQGNRRTLWAATGVMVVVIGVIASVTWLRGRSGSDADDAKAPDRPARRAIAVLPFVNSSGSTDDEYLPTA